jgi:hypothetical protein
MMTSSTISLLRGDMGFKDTIKPKRMFRNFIKNYDMSSKWSYICPI